MAPLKLRASVRPCRPIRHTSMTILSWPHWSSHPGSLNRYQAWHFHDYFVMAPLKHLPSMRSLFSNGHFHDYFVMAPLKPKYPTIADWIRINFHDYFVMAPLKLRSLENVQGRFNYFHDYFVMAPLKHIWDLWHTTKVVGLPWLFCHGPIEADIILFPLIPNIPTSMTILSWPHWSLESKSKVDSRPSTSMTILSWPHWSPLV